MAVRLDHTILDVKNLAESVAFYRDVVGLEHRGRSGGFEVMLITDDLALDLDAHAQPASRHLAFGMRSETPRHRDAGRPRTRRETHHRADACAVGASTLQP